MITLATIKDIHERLGNVNTLPDYLRALHEAGVTDYDSFVSDGHSEYHEADGTTLTSEPVHKTLVIADTGNEAAMHEALELTDYIEMSKALAESGVEKWRFDTTALTITYYDKAGMSMLAETIS